MYLVGCRVSLIVDEILVSRPLLLMKRNSHIVDQIITLTSEGLLSSVNLQGIIQWSIQTKVVWNELDEASVSILFMSIPIALRSHSGKCR